MDSEEQRLFPRIPGNLIAQICIANDDDLPGRDEDMTVKDISKGGVFIETDSPYEPGDKIKLVLFLPESNQVLSIKAVVRWRKESAPQGIGVELWQACAADESWLNQYIDDGLSPDVDDSF